MDEIIIEKGDYINGAEVVEILKDPFKKGQIEIFVNEYEDDFFGDQRLKKYVIKKVEEENE